MEDSTSERLRRYLMSRDGSTAEAIAGLTSLPSESPAEPIYAKRRGKLVLIGWQLWLVGTSTPPLPTTLNDGTLIPFPRNRTLQHDT